MKLNINKQYLLVAITLFTGSLFAQKKGDKTVVFMNYTFDKPAKNSEIEDEGVSEEHWIDRLENCPATIVDKGADLFWGRKGDFKEGDNQYGYAKNLLKNNDDLPESDKILFYGKSEPDTMKQGYAGIVAFFKGKPKEKTYITLPFYDNTGKPMKMIAKKTYCIEMSVSLAEASKFAINNLGMLFVKDIDSYQGREPGRIDKESGRVVLNYRNKIYNSYSGWDKVCNMYTAKGDETGLLIGNFFQDDSTKQEPMKKITDAKKEFGSEDIPDQLNFAYYYIDNVRIKEAKRGECNCIKGDTTAADYEFSKTNFSKEPTVTDKMTPEEKFAANTIYYSFGKYSLSPTAVNSRDFIIEMLLKNPKWTVELVGHNDVEEERAAAEIEDLTEELSDMDQKRVDKLKYDLIQKGIDETRISISVKDAKEVNQDEFDESDDTELQWAKNRRVEFILRRN